MDNVPIQVTIGREDNTLQNTNANKQCYVDLAWSQEVKSVLGYRVNKGAEVEDMVSIALRFEPLHSAAYDPVKLASIKPAKVDECDLATKALKKVSKLLDVDKYLSSEKTIEDEMIKTMCELLEAARYDVSEYPAWLAKQ